LRADLDYCLAATLDFLGDAWLPHHHIDSSEEHMQAHFSILAVAAGGRPGSASRYGTAAVATRSGGPGQNELAKPVLMSYCKLHCSTRVL